ncbi:MAG: T9SS type A sorting domain-containing protein [Flavobacteriales bacterium]|nr:T9SS type A sorting domain-containing protein [Flavobacteriales bacterium]
MYWEIGIFRVRSTAVSRLVLIVTILMSMLSDVGRIQAATFTTTQNGDWSDPATWGGVYVSSFFPTPVTVPNWFTAGAGDVIIIDHDVNMDYPIFVRSPDVLIINTGASLVSTTHSFYNLSLGDPSTTYSSIQAGVFSFGDLSVHYMRNNTELAILGGRIEVNSSGDFDNLGDVYVQGALDVDGDLNHNSGNLIVSGGGNITVGTGDFQNRSILELNSNSACVDIQQGAFNNLLGAVVLGSGTVRAFGNIDNGSNGTTNWSGVSWCTSGTSVNIPISLEDCLNFCGTSVLPVELLYFDAKTSGSGVQLDWATASEVNNSHFIIQNSVDGMQFSELGRMMGAGNSSIQLDYSFHDDVPPHGLSYYRLLQVDYDGTTTTYDPVVVEYQRDESTFGLYPNPASTMIHILNSNPDRIYMVKIVDRSGKRILSRIGQESIDVSELRPDMYYVLIEDLIGVTHFEKLLIE